MIIENTTRTINGMTIVVNTAVVGAPGLNSLEQWLLENPGATEQDYWDFIAPTIGPNGNWWVQGQDTGNPSVGQSGIISFRIDDNMDLIETATNGAPYEFEINENGELIIK